MICRDHIDTTVVYGFQERGTILCRFDRRIALDTGTEVLVVGIVKAQVMHANFSGNALVLAMRFRKEPHFDCRCQVQHM